MFQFYENFRERIIEKVKNTNFIGPYLKKSDLVVTTCGITKYEIAAMKIPALIIPISRKSAKKNYHFHKLGTSVCLKYNPSIKDIRKNILKLNNYDLRKSLFNSCWQCFSTRTSSKTSPHRQANVFLATAL